jgi:hypothetical protein
MGWGFCFAPATRRPFTLGSSERPHAGALNRNSIKAILKPPGGNNDQNNGVCFVRVGARFRRTSHAVLAGS